MKPLSILLLAFVVVSCSNHSKNQKTDEHDSLEKLVEPVVDLRKAVEYDSVEHDTIDKKVLQSPALVAARKKFRGIQLDLEKALATEKMVNIRGSETKVKYHWLSAALLKIELRENRENSMINKEYYLENEQPVLVFEMETNRLEMEKEPDYYEPTEDSLFFYENRLIRVVCNMDCGGPFASKYLMEEEIRIKAELDVLLRAAH